MNDLLAHTHGDPMVGGLDYALIRPRASTPEVVMDRFGLLDLSVPRPIVVDLDALVILLRDGWSDERCPKES